MLIRLASNKTKIFFIIIFSGKKATWDKCRKKTGKDKDIERLSKISFANFTLIGMITFIYSRVCWYLY